MNELLAFGVDGGRWFVWRGPMRQGPCGKWCQWRSCRRRSTRVCSRLPFAQAVALAGLQPAECALHSLRIGRATFLAAGGALRRKGDGRGDSRYQCRCVRNVGSDASRLPELLENAEGVNIVRSRGRVPDGVKCDESGGPRWILARQQVVDASSIWILGREFGSRARSSVNFTVGFRMKCAKEACRGGISL
ncbi:unnamed protein product [Ectocarpus sp. 12 AP-2014]